MYCRFFQTYNIQTELEELLKSFKDGDLVNNPFIVDINLSMKEDKKEIFKELILNYLLKQIMEEK